MQHNGEAGRSILDDACRRLGLPPREAIEGGFAADLKVGRLHWCVLNIEEPANEHFIEDFRLTTCTVVLAQSDKGRPGRWKNLAGVWQLVGDKQAFPDHLRREVHSSLQMR